MTGDFSRFSASFRVVLCAALGLTAVLAAVPAAADHLPPGSQVVYMRQPSYLGTTADRPRNRGQDIEQAKELAKLGDAEAENNLGVMLAARGDFKAAVNLFKQASAGGVASAAYNLGLLYSAGHGVEQDPVLAHAWFETAAGRGDACAQFQLGRLAADASSEMGWYLKAAQQGLPAAQYNLAVMYHNGEGTAADDLQAYALLLAASRNGVDVSEAKPVILAKLSSDQSRDAEALSHSWPVWQPLRASTTFPQVTAIQVVSAQVGRVF